ncbi:AsmA family protein [Roseomonas sp. OT10]|uniref:AsmA family protein n=1 Tax=Roseomonas cutis TaxID=2897332 RepID=UPI001E2AAF99|nr:AsmA family protein [Roseomonas sp. OT10]UFN51193.1 AsmA family protein [Roseomonas sp. OT10]
MPRRIPRWLIWVGGPVAVLLLAVLLFSWSWFIPLVESQASAALGRPVHVARMQVRLGRVTEVTFGDVQVDNPPGFPPDPPFARIPRLTLRLDVMEYWRSRRVAIPLIEAERPQVEALAREDGSNNYTFPFGEPAGESDPDGAQATAAAAPRIDLLRVIEGQAHVVVPTLGADFQLAVATRDEAGPEPKIAVEARGTYGGQPITGRLLGGAVLALQDATKPWPVEMELANGPTRVALAGTLQNPLAFQGADLKLRLSGPDMALLQPLTGIPLPKTPNYQVEGQLDYVAGRVRFRDFGGRMGRSDLNGTITVTTGAGKPDVTADLRSRRVDLADLGGFIGEEPGRVSTPGQTPQQRREVARAEASSRLLPDEPLNLPKLEAANVHLKYRADSIIGRNMPFDTMGAEMEIENGAVTLKPLTLGVGRGQIAGNISLVPGEDGALRARADVQFQRLDVSRLMQATGAFEGAGVLGGRAVIEGSGKSLAAILGSGNGSLTLTMAGGGNLSALLVDLSGLRLANALLSLLKLPDRTQVECFLGDFALRRGVLSTRTLLLDTDDVLVQGTGTIDMGRERLNMRLQSDSKGFTIGQLPAPILIEGTFRNPSVMPEVGELVARGGIASGLGFLAAPLALLPTIQFGVGDDNRCEGLVRRSGGARQGNGRTGR